MGNVDYALAVTGALTGQQWEEILERYLARNPAWQAGAAEVIDVLTSTNSDADQLKPFFEANPDLGEGAGEAARALIWSGQELTRDAVLALLGRAQAGAR